MVSRLLALVAVAACVVPLACGGDDDDADDPPRTLADATRSATATLDVTERQAVISYGT